MGRTPRDQTGIQLSQDTLEAITKINIPKNEENLKTFQGAIQYLSKYIENLSAKTDTLRKLLKNKTNGFGQKKTRRRSTT